MKNSTLLIILVALAASFTGNAAEVRLNGASTTTNAVIIPHKAAVEAATGITIKAIGTNTGKGLAALVAGQCDASLTSEPLDVSMIAGEFAGLKLNAADFQLHPVVEDYAVFVVHPSNPVSKLSQAQIKEILAGRILNWKEVGGADLPILVFTDAVGAGTRTLIQVRVLGGENYGAKTKALEGIRVVANNIGELENSCGYVGRSFVTASLKKIDAETIVRPLGFITKGAPTPEVKKVIDAYRAAAGK